MPNEVRLDTSHYPEFGSLPGGSLFLLRDGMVYMKLSLRAARVPNDSECNTVGLGDGKLWTIDSRSPVEPVTRPVTLIPKV